MRRFTHRQPLNASDSTTPSALIDRRYVELAPVDLESRLASRYHGDDMAAALSELEAADLAKIRRMYELLSEANLTLKGMVERHDSMIAFVALVHERFWDEILDLAHALASNRTGHSPLLDSALHDIRGGSLNGLLGTVQMARLAPVGANDCLRCFSYVRDHLKIMRNCLPALDPIAVARDREVRVHSVDLLAQKWGAGKFNYDGQECEVAFACTYQGNVSDRCMEFAALDRVLYNLMNNAARHTSDRRIGLTIFAPGPQSASVRFVVANRISATHVAALGKLAGADTSVLLQGGKSTTGSGLGLRICTDFVAHAFGVATITAAIRGRYIGARLLGDEFVVWFHWPRGSAGVSA
jgi:signal transduction histidine kinase